MQSESSQCEEETPSLLWGLDPVFLAFAKLYIRDILDLKESCQVPGVFLYNGHPIKQVDILGTVIEVREKDAFYSYGVDDSTGVIKCVCWKKLSNTESLPAAPSTARELSLTSQLKKLQETIKQRTKLEIGDIIRIRGYIRTYRGQREIHATAYYKVDDPVWNIQIARMLELPIIYRKVYDQPFRSPALEKEKALSNPGAPDLTALTCLLSEKAKEFLVENRVQTFYQQELEMVESLLSLARQPVVHSTCSNHAACPREIPVPAPSLQLQGVGERDCGVQTNRVDQGTEVTVQKDTTSKAIHSIFKNAIQLLQERGLVFQKDGGFNHLYYVTRADKDLHRNIRRLIQAECQKPNHIEKGCHFLHILACARLSVLPGLSEAVLRQVLELLEDQSDIVSTMEHHYMAF
ncbi:CST complex subunit STN1 isoform X1 [Nycticebus coucang]|uniref:CST complex subunit STN1 isoform X1 n=1 Tax=Nycticebus coucang TaxID=9470 RepID=UPI00234CC1CC|nr:CST complex subunit STN1 isoform X1 [Nycticebus coucang]XP_053439131.1 CST complex subunit STN1 isoform X1 [Nycticebus coucang]XP_053439133.1 CST complex subunit STN1 isoform X1 [Nycticebus coucang]